MKDLDGELALQRELRGNAELRRLADELVKAIATETTFSRTISGGLLAEDPGLEAAGRTARGLVEDALKRRRP